MTGQISGCLSKSKSLSVSESNCIYGGALKDCFPYPAYPCTFLGGKKSTKRTGPAAWPPASLAQTVFSERAGTRPPSVGSNSLPAFSRKNRLRSAALQWAGAAINAPIKQTKTVAPSAYLMINGVKET
ncbi:hypothetical protein [Desulfosudis oleivorans]|uniref:hypothetical protein n=1 Tax=Desulfosudis oleivorans TaxID=181663 RepID=UPI00129472A8|nr:hypothetical protein [Desulfosudis oleivorans]